MDLGTPGWWATPFLTGALGVIAAYVGIKFDLRKSSNQELIKKRLAIYDKTAPLLNEILCFYLCLGPWRSLSPEQMLENKRALDRDMHIYAPLFSARLMQEYEHFMEASFAIYRGYGNHAILRANIRVLKSNWRDSWNDKWNDFFDESISADLNHVEASYQNLMDAFGAEVGIRRLTWPGNLRSRIIGRSRSHIRTAKIDDKQSAAPLVQHRHAAVHPSARSHDAKTHYGRHLGELSEAGHEEYPAQPKPKMPKLLHTPPHGRSKDLQQKPPSTP